jgi:paraquat-inducible protein A
VLVAVVKLGDVATLIIGTSLWSFAGLIVTMTAASSILDPFTVWRELDKTHKVKPHE